MGKFDGVLLASDFDNTLVYTQAAIEAGSDAPEMNARNREAIAYFMRGGGRFSVSTGRAVPAFAAFASEVPMNAPAIVANGAGIYDFAAERYLYTAFLTARVREHMREVLRAFPDLALEVYHADRRIHAMHPNRYILGHQHLTRAKAQVVDDFDDIDLPVIKVLFEEDPARLAAVEAFIRSRPWIGEYELIYSTTFLLELTARGATKGDMVLRLARMLGVRREDIYCVGDHGNDLSMLAVAAEGFAPANAIDAVKQSGATIVCHCADGALADVIDILDRRYQ